MIRFTEACTPAPTGQEQSAQARCWSGAPIRQPSRLEQLQQITGCIGMCMKCGCGIMRGDDHLWCEGTEW